MDRFSYTCIENLERNITTNISLRFCQIVLPPGKRRLVSFYSSLVYLKLVVINKNTVSYFSLNISSSQDVSMISKADLVFF